MPSPVRVFLVEDSPIIRERLIESLSVPGRIEIIGSADSESAAVAALRSPDWDALVLDLQLKHGNGLGVLKAVGPRDRARGAKVIVFTNYAFPQYRAKTEQLGADHFFEKAREYHRIREVLDAMASAPTPLTAAPVTPH